MSRWTRISSVVSSPSRRTTVWNWSLNTDRCPNNCLYAELREISPQFQSGLTSQIEKCINHSQVPGETAWDGTVLTQCYFRFATRFSAHISVAPSPAFCSAPFVVDLVGLGSARLEHSPSWQSDPRYPATAGLMSLVWVLVIHNARDVVNCFSLDSFHHVLGHQLPLHRGNRSRSCAEGCMRSQ